MKILVTGGSGFLGSHVADELTNNGHKVIIYDLLKSKWLKKNQKFLFGNITDTKKLSRLMSKVDIVYNFAALGDLDKARFMPIETVNFNILSLVNMLKLSKNSKSRGSYRQALYMLIVRREDFMEEVKELPKIIWLNLIKLLHFHIQF